MPLSDERTRLVRGDERLPRQSRRLFLASNPQMFARRNISRLRLPDVGLHRSPDNLDQVYFSDSASERVTVHLNGDANKRAAPVSQGTQLYAPQELRLSFATLLPYYLPCALWIPSYSFRNLVGDVVAGLLLALFQIPLLISYARAVAHVPALCGLYGLALAPMVYALFGLVPQMIVGPESAILLVVGQAVEPLVAHHLEMDPVDIVCVMTFLSGAILLAFGIGRFGFLDNILSAALLRGFILGVGVIMVVNLLVLELGLAKVLKKVPASEHYHLLFDKLFFLWNYRHKIHPLTACILLVAFLVLIFFKLVKLQLLKARVRAALFFPEILVVVLVLIGLSNLYDWHGSGVAVVGHNSLDAFAPRVPITGSRFDLIKNLFTSSFTVAMLGFFELTTALKLLGLQYNLPILLNRELVALGALNVFLALLGALPLFGGYGRLKINALSGATTTLSGCFMGIFTFLTIRYLLRFTEQLPVSILLVITTLVGLSLLDEAPSDIIFFWRAGGWGELTTFVLTFTATIFSSVELGIALGLGYSMIRVIRHATKSRIQILVRIPNLDVFVDADEPVPDELHQTMVVPEALEEIEGCLIVRVPEPLVFTNAEDLKLRLRRLELYGSTVVHPAAPRTRSEAMTRYLILDLKGMTELDASAAQILHQIVSLYRARHIHVFFARVSTVEGVRRTLRNSGITAMLETYAIDGGAGISHYFRDINDALRVVDQYEDMRGYVE